MSLYFLLLLRLKTYLHSSTWRGCFSQFLLQRGPWQAVHRCHVLLSGAAHPRHMGLDCSRLGPTTAAFSLRMMSPGFISLVATMYLKDSLVSHWIDFANNMFWDIDCLSCFTSQLFCSLWQCKAWYRLVYVLSSLTFGNLSDSRPQRNILNI